jgi:hypothetical protein
MKVLLRVPSSHQRLSILLKAALSPLSMLNERFLHIESGHQTPHEIINAEHPQEAGLPIRFLS